MVVHAENLWAAYGPCDEALTVNAKVLLQGLQSRPEINGTSANILSWDGIAGRFAVSLKNSEKIKVRPSCLRPVGQRPMLQVCVASPGHLGPLDVELDLAVGGFLSSAGIAVLSTTSRALRAALWLHADASPLWETLLSRRNGHLALDAARRTRSSAKGPALYRGAMGLRHVFRNSVEIVRGGVDSQVDGCEVVACPVLRSLTNVGIGAQGAIRTAAGTKTEMAIACVEKPVAEMSTTLVTGGSLAHSLALVVTEPPEFMRTSHDDQRIAINSVLGWMSQIHERLLLEVRRAGFRSVAMPTLATGGVGVPEHLVAIAALQAIHQDFLAHPADPIRVRIACFEVTHVPSFNSIKDEILDNFFRPEQVDKEVKATLYAAYDQLGTAP